MVRAATADEPTGQAVELTIEAAVERAYAGNFRVARAGRNEQIADVRAQAVRAGRLPRVSVGVGLNQAARGTYQATPAYTREQGLTGDFRTGVNLAAQMPVDLSGALKRQIDQADLGARMSEIEADQARVEAAFEVRSAYVAALRAREVAALDERMVETIVRLAERADPGTAPFLAVELSAARQARSTSQAAAEGSDENLRHLARIPPDVRLVLATSFEAIAGPQTAADAGVERRPDVRQAKLRIDQADIAVRQATDALRPSMTVNAYFNQAWSGRSALDAGESRNRDQGGVVALNVPLYTIDWGVGSSAKRIARLSAEQARADLDERRERAEYEVRQAAVALARAEARLASLPREEQALAALRQAEAAFLAADSEERRSLLAQVSNARSAWREARLAALGAIGDRSWAVVRMERAVGIAGPGAAPAVAARRAAGTPFSPATGPPDKVSP